MLVGQLVVWLALALGISRFDTATLVRRRSRRGSVEPEAPLLSIDAPIGAAVDHLGDRSVDEPGEEVLTSIGDETVSWQSEPEPGAPEHRDVGQHQAGVE